MSQIWADVGRERKKEKQGKTEKKFFEKGPRSKDKDFEIEYEKVEDLSKTDEKRSYERDQNSIDSKRNGQK